MNDVAFVPQPEELGALLDEWDCLRNQAGGFGVRNSCRAPARHALDARLRVGLGRLGGAPVSFYVEGFDLFETEDGLIDDAIVLVDPAAPIRTTGAGRTVIDTVPNPDFGRILVPSSRGRMLRIGLKVGT